MKSTCTLLAEELAQSDEPVKQSSSKEKKFDEYIDMFEDYVKNL